MASERLNHGDCIHLIAHPQSDFQTCALSQIIFRVADLAVCLRAIRRTIPANKSSIDDLPISAWFGDAFDP